jgi:hypothetical protein
MDPSLSLLLLLVVMVVFYGDFVMMMGRKLDENLVKNTV